SGTSAVAAQNPMDHGSMTERQPETVPANADHSAVEHGAEHQPSAPNEEPGTITSEHAADHGAMDQGKTDHAAMRHGPMESAGPAGHEAMTGALGSYPMQ